MTAKDAIETWRRRAASEPGTLLFESSADDEAKGRSLLFAHPLQILTVNQPTGVRGLLGELEKALRQGYYVAGYLTYEAGAALQGVTDHRVGGRQLAWFGVYSASEVQQATPAAAPKDRERIPLCVEMEMRPEPYRQAIAAVKQKLAAGDTYQVNLTTAVQFGYRGEIAALFEALAQQQPAPYLALLHTAEGEHILSFSPELFFRVEAEGRIVTRPMKGTAALSSAQGSAEIQARWLHGDSKNRAEHVMIVDLLRNDLGRVCETGSVQVEKLFAVEQYRTLLQMTSTISGRLRQNAGLGAIFEALFPSGSMTGAPKQRTMEIIRELEPTPRGVYSGAIGFAAPDGTCAFSVAIRTLLLERGHARMGVGGGIVADSQADDERSEAWLKAKFLLQTARPYCLVETMRWDGGYGWLEEHMDRLEVSAEGVGYALDRVALTASLLAFGAILHGPQRVRILVERDGSFRFETSALRLWSATPRVRLGDQPVWSGDSFLAHKTDFRPVYDKALAQANAAGFDDVLFVNERDEFTEGTISSMLFRIAGEWVTPPLASGVLPGVARALLLRRRLIQERTVRRDELDQVEAIALANGIRGTAAILSLELAPGNARQFTLAEDVPRL